VSYNAGAVKTSNATNFHCNSNGRSVYIKHAVAYWRRKRQWSSCKCSSREIGFWNGCFDHNFSAILRLKFSRSQNICAVIFSPEKRLCCQSIQQKFAKDATIFRHELLGPPRPRPRSTFY
jgi:hypothetical protein